jgi:predicted lactoylglutathione lyase
MTKQIYVNLPVKNLEKSKEFFAKLGFNFNNQFTDEKAACLILGDSIYAMLLEEKFFQTFTKKEICDAQKHTEVLIALSSDSREEVDEILGKAVEAGGLIYKEAQDHGWMYVRSFADLDGHQWEFLFMDEEALSQMNKKN